MKLKRILALVLAFCMVFTSMSLSAFAEGEAYVAEVDGVQYETLADALANVGAGDVVIDLLADAELSYGAREAYGSDDTTSITINGNNHTLTLNQTDSDWSSIGMKNADGVFKINNVTVEKTGYGDTSGAWNTHAINFNVDTEFKDVTFNNSIKVSGTSVLTNVNVVEENGYYGIWIPADAESVTINGGSITATNGGRGIKIADQYVDAPAEVKLTVDGMTFKTAKKAAVLVSSTAGADITAVNCDISEVEEDSTNFVWVDEDWSSSADKVTVDGGSVFVEGAIVIENIDALKTFRDNVNAGNTYEGKYVILANDIDLTGENWEPIGNDTNYFWGTFDGDNHTISNMTIDIESEGNVFAGLFGGVRKATIKNLRMTNVNIDVVGAKVRAAAVAGLAHSNSENRTDATLNFENITVNGCTINAEATSSSAMVGGIAGYCYPSNMKNITVSGLTINGKTSGNNALYTAALAGYVCGQNISNNGNTRAAMLCENFKVEDFEVNAEAYTLLAGAYTGEPYYGFITFNNGIVDGIKIVCNAHEAFVGGLVGYFWRSDKGHSVKDVNITGIDFDITTDYLGETRIGGMVGTSQSPVAYADCSVAGTITERCSDSANPVNYHAKVGGFVGRAYTWAQTYTNCTADVDVTGSHVAGGFVGNHITNASYTNCEAKGDVTADIAGGFVGRLTENDFSTAVTFDNCKASGNVTGTNVAGGLIGSTVDHGWAAWEAGKGTPYAKTVTLVDCEATGTVTSNTNYCAGVVGEAVMKDGVDLILDNVAHTVDPAFYPANANVKTKVAKINDETFDTLAEAINKANGAIVTLIADTTESITIAEDATVVIDLNRHTLYGYIAPSKPNSLTVKNGTIVNGNYEYSAIEVNSGKLTVENVNIDSERHAVRIDGPVDATINGGVYKVLVNNEVTAHAVNVSGAATVTIKDGTFYGPKGTPNGSAMGGSALNSRDTAVVTVEGGYFAGGVDKTINGNAVSNVSIKGGVFDQDPTSYVADGYVASGDADGTLYMVTAERTLRLVPSATEVKTGNTFTVDVYIDTADVWEVEWVLDYNDTLFEIVEMTTPYTNWGDATKPALYATNSAIDETIPVATYTFKKNTMAATDSDFTFKFAEISILTDYESVNNITVPCNDAEFSIKINLDYVVEVDLSKYSYYISGKKLVLVYTNATGITFDYDGIQMYEVTGAGYKYNGEESFTQTDDTKVYALVVDAIDKGAIEDYEVKVSPDYLETATVIIYDKKYEFEDKLFDNDVSGDSYVKPNDITNVYLVAVCNEIALGEMDIMLKADVDGDKQVNMFDAKSIINELYGK